MCATLLVYRLLFSRAKRIDRTLTTGTLIDRRRRKERAQQSATGKLSRPEAQRCDAQFPILDLSLLVTPYLFMPVRNTPILWHTPKLKPLHPFRQLRVTFGYWWTGPWFLRKPTSSLDSHFVVISFNYTTEPLNDVPLFFASIYPISGLASPHCCKWQSSAPLRPPNLDQCSEMFVNQWLNGSPYIFTHFKQWRKIKEK